MGESTNYNNLIARLDQFIRKYYINKAIKGSLLCIAVCLALFMIYGLFESQFYFSQGVRKFFFFSFIISAIGMLGYWVVNPLVRYFRLGSVISHEQAAQILGDHFDDMGDKLLNILQLKKSNNSDQLALINASIEQKSEAIRLVPFKNAIDLSKNKKYLKYALPPVLSLIFILFAAPSLITDSTYRIINNNQDFEREAPFTFELDESELEVVQFSDYTLTANVDGEQLPNDVLINVAGYDYRMKKVANDQFEYTFSNVRKDTEFKIYSGAFGTKDYTLKVLPKPQLLNYSVDLDYPGYTRRRDEILSNTGDITIPEGTKVTWRMTTAATDGVDMRFSDAQPVSVERTANSTYTYDRRVNDDLSYTISIKNKHVPTGDSLSFWIRSVKDARPEISVEMIQDSAAPHISYFAGQSSDDYGLSKLQWVYTVSDDKGAELRSGSEPISITPSVRVDYEYLFDVKEFGLQPGERVSYYFEVFDNDRVNGAKSARTQAISYRQPSIEELKEDEQANEEVVKDKLEDSIKEASEIQKELQKLREKLLQKEQPDWKDKKKLEQLLKRQEQLQQQLQEAQNANQKNIENQQEFMNVSPEMMQKQQRLQELFDEVVNDEMKELMDEVQKLMEELGKEQSLEKMEEFKMNEETLEKEMERLSELYKQLEVEKEMNESIEALEELAEELEKLSEETAKEDSDSEEIKKEQEEIEKKLEEEKEKIEELMEKNDELEFPKNIPDDAPEQMEDIQDDMEESQENLDQGQKSESSKKQKSAAQKMKQMAGSMKQKMQQGQEQQQQEDLETIRQLLENLVSLSFDQEGLVSQVNRTNPTTPRYTELVQDQMRIKDDFAVVEDTLQALSKRQPDIETYVLEKVGEAKLHLEKSLTQLEARETPEANQSQRTTMTNLNDLALMLSESMEQMQQQMSGQMSGCQNCQNPGDSGSSGSQPKDKISKGQEKMSEKLKQMSENMKNGKGNSSKDFAEAAARQAALRKALEKMQQEMQENGKGGSNQLQEIIDEMDKQEIDLVNKKLDNEMLLRQQEIVTRLLEAEKAQKEREYDEKRQSKEGQDVKQELPPAIKEYIEQRKAQLEEYKYVSPEMKPYYKRLVEKYYKELKRS